MTNPAEPPLAIWERPIVKQFLMFLFVGAISFMIDNGIRFILLFFVKSGDHPASEDWGRGLMEHYPSLFSFAKKPTEAFYPVAAVLGSFVATFNSYVMNRALTFKIKEKTDAGKQFIKVFIVNYIGLGINVVISTIFFAIVPGHAKISAIIAGVIGAGVAAIWNFAGQRYFAFKVHKPE